MSATHPAHGARVAVLVDCDNTRPELLGFALARASRLGRTEVRRGYGNHATLAKHWQEALVAHAFTPCLQYQYAQGKNTADIALALDALELRMDGRVDTFCIVTSDSDFTYLCRKLRERGASVVMIGEAKTPGALRHAADEFIEWTPDARPQQHEAAAKRSPAFVVEAVATLAGASADGQVDLAALGQHLKRVKPAFSSAAYGHASLLKMLRHYDRLVLTQTVNGHYRVGLTAPTAAA